MSVDESWSIIEQYLDEHGELHLLRGPVPTADLEALRTGLAPLAVPDELAWSLERHDGGEPCRVIVDDFELLSAEAVLSDYRSMASTFPRASYVPGWWSTDWLPFAVSKGGDFLCLDLRDGSVFYHAHDEGPHAATYASYGAWLAAIANDVKAGRTAIREHSIEAAAEGRYLIDIGQPLLD